MVNRNYLFGTDQIVESDRFVLFFKQQILVSQDDFVFDRSQIGHLLTPDTELMAVGALKEATIVALELESDHSAALNGELSSLRSLLFKRSDYDFSIAGKASQILDWYATHKYCGKCGQATRHHVSERAVFCNACNLQFYPRINPCVIVLVTRGRKMLLARSARFRSGFYSCLAGFIEVGETPEQTIAREVMEEVGLEVDNIRYIKSQSWPFPSQLMLGYFADYKAGNITPAAEEIEEADWYSPSRLPNVPSAEISVAGELIQRFVDSQS
ncbi:MAG: NAD(+) diphosphatase [Gammaproteobacteria bacterium]|jgi:NAD+ diphosphatase|nr:NAD(+) diphosphatase [Gammaproteobacteria bacterium]MDP7456062.1 NAD(+) diphosphatase [Gammaproteobacteria bacterium]|tara:strand:- start:40 stop:849 length:810 start_codon:yes stop_codon:yes gene_type:complete